jgi:putative tryptophan/tyrosine transport system substrate-binding protein
MRRRQFIAIIGGAAAAWPLVARAQSSGGIRRIGVLTNYSGSDPVAEEWLASFRKGLEALGWHDGHNIQIEYRRTAGDAGRLAALAKELVAAQPDVIFAVTTPAVAALLRETHTIPIVFAQVSDPVGSGFAASVARPGSNVTGFTDINIEASIGGKWLELVTQIAPAVRREIMIYNPPTAPFANYYLRPFEAAGTAHKVQTQAAAVDSDVDIENALSALAREPGGGFVVMPDTFTNIHRDRIVALAAHYRLPAVYPFRWFADIGGLMSYGIDTDDMFRRAAAYVDRILKGEKPADLPVQGPTKFELVVNQKTAKALGLKVPEPLLVTADEVIE